MDGCVMGWMYWYCLAMGYIGHYLDIERFDSTRFEEQVGIKNELVDT
ncbi:predicted protein [Sclerotinia sclerotiorum 1980 UF-70]|uniref:Uncharacterized protein n=1 Tax=Sclerotinia sclerotiorum (strain ATCC 18683 / 1980 / Ss-1) TaxID=665079 RepID=A7E6A5_SCLS1|nr:predicted protein [Sclerotinia sclerotiorum 1980 UF-70]EDN91427.1 predicted protein [Sclerotinia sclerotiorum 1980 UF-70]